jgi:hypothetical protein
MEPHDLAQEGLKRLKEAVIGLLKTHPEGLRNAEIASTLGIRSDHRGKQRNYLSFSILGLLMGAGEVIKTSDRRYKIAPPGASELAD